MKGDKNILIIVVAGAMTMILLFSAIVVQMVKLNTKSSSQSDTEESAAETKAQVDYDVVEVEDKIYTEEEIDLDVDDVASHDVEVEQLAVNTTELLPSLTNEREMIPKSKISDEAFPKSFVGSEMQELSIWDTTIEIPRDVYLYNTNSDKSASYQLTIDTPREQKAIKRIGWSSGDANVLSVSKASGNTVTIQKKQDDFVGTVPLNIVITYYVTASETATEEMTCNVNMIDMTDEMTPLCDIQGNSLYTDKEGEHLAHLSDYGKQDYFYGEVKTTGWQVIDQKRYYYNAQCQPVTGQQIIGGMSYTFDDTGVLVSAPLEMGIDVSKWQKDIDWAQVAASGVSFAIIRCGYRGAVSGKLVEDPCFRKNIEGAQANGIQVGVYFFTQAVTELEAVEEASMALAMCGDYQIDLPIYIDSEGVENGRANQLDKDSRTRILRAFCETINNNGRMGGVYASKCWFYDNLDAKQLENYSIWVAQYNTECNYTGKTDFWQYSSRETIAGIEGNVDVDVVRISPGE